MYYMMVSLVVDFVATSSQSFVQNRNQVRTCKEKITLQLIPNLKRVMYFSASTLKPTPITKEIISLGKCTKLGGKRLIFNKNHFKVIFFRVACSFLSIRINTSLELPVAAHSECNWLTGSPSPAAKKQMRFRQFICLLMNRTADIQCVSYLL